MLRLITTLIVIMFTSQANAYTLYKVENNQIAVQFNDLIEDSAEKYKCYIGESVYTIELNTFFNNNGYTRGTMITLTGSTAGTSTQYCKAVYNNNYASTGEEVELQDGRTGIFYED